MKTLRKIYDAFDKGVSFITAVLMLSVLILVSLQVVYRFFLHRSMGGYEELPVFLLLSMVWLAGILVAKRDDHIKIDLLTTSIHNQRAIAVLTTATSCITTICSALYSVLCWSFVMKAIGHRTLSPALRFPLWYVYAVTLIASSLDTVFFAINTIKGVFRICKPAEKEDKTI